MSNGALPIGLLTRSTDPGGLPLGYRWQVAKRPERSSAKLGEAESLTPSTSPTYLAGRYPVQLPVENSAGEERQADQSAGNQLVIAALEPSEYVIVPVPDWSSENVAKVLPVLVDVILPLRMRFVLSPSVT
jgi:hypothetical protein